MGRFSSLAQMPDVAVILGDGAVGGEHPRFDNVHQTLAPPAHGVAGVIAEGLPLPHDVCVEVRQGLEPVLMDQFVVQAGQVFGMTRSQHLRAGEEADGTADVGIALHPLGRVVVADGIAMDDLIGGLAEDIDVLFPHLLADLHSGTVHGAQGQRTVQHELHVAGAGRLLAGGGNLLADIRCRKNQFCVGNAVIFGLSADEVINYENNGGYNPEEIFNTDQDIRRVLMQLINGYYSPQDPELFRDIYNSLLNTKNSAKADTYFILKDFRSYAEAQKRVEAAYRDENWWARAAMLNTASAGKFSSDRTIEEYVRDIWHLEKIRVDDDDVKAL